MLKWQYWYTWINKICANSEVKNGFWILLQSEGIILCTLILYMNYTLVDQQICNEDYNEDKSRSAYKSKYTGSCCCIFLRFPFHFLSFYLCILSPTWSLWLVVFPYPILLNVKKRISLISHAPVNYFPCLRVFRLVFPFVH